MLHFAAKKLIENSPNMVLILDDNSEIGAHEWSDLDYLICLRHFFGSREATNLIFFFKERMFSFSAQHGS